MIGESEIVAIMQFGNLSRRVVDYGIDPRSSSTAASYEKCSSGETAGGSVTGLDTATQTLPRTWLPIISRAGWRWFLAR
jgi:hypothetical protein